MQLRAEFKLGVKIYLIFKNDILIEKDAKEVFELGEIAYWNVVETIAIGFGPTPVAKIQKLAHFRANHWANAKTLY